MNSNLIPKPYSALMNLSVIVMVLGLLQSGVSLAQHTPIPTGIYDLKTNAVLGVIETRVEANQDRTETWKLLQEGYPNQDLRFREISKAEFDRIAAQSVFEVPQRLEYLAPPSSSEISRYPSLTSLVDVSLKSSQVLEYRLTRNLPAGGSVVEGAMYREILVAVDGSSYVRDTWRLFSNYVFPNKTTELRMQQVTSGVSGRVQSFLTKNAAKGGSWVVLSPRQGDSLWIPEPGGNEW